jgi:hypothetical protein
MSKFLLILLIGVVVYYFFKWSKSSDGNKNSSRSTGDNVNSTNANQSDAGKQGSSYGKWLGGGLGWAFGGPIGGILGFVLARCTTICRKESLNTGKVLPAILI